MYQYCCVGACKNFYFGFPEDGVLVLKRVGILYVMYDFEYFYVHSLLTALVTKMR